MSLVYNGRFRIRSGRESDVYNATSDVKGQLSYITDKESIEYQSREGVIHKILTTDSNGNLTTAIRDFKADDFMASSITLRHSHQVTNFTTDQGLTEDSDYNVPTERAVKAYVDGLVCAIVRNDTASTIPKGAVVYATGQTGEGHLTVDKADASVSYKSRTVAGIAGVDILSGGYGRVLSQGSVGGVNTTDLDPSKPLYLSATTPGAVTNIRPTYPNQVVYVGASTTGASSDSTIEANIKVIDRSMMFKDYSFTSYGLSSDAYYAGGFYEAASSAVIATSAGYVNYGTAGVAYAAHAFIVIGPNSGFGASVTVSGTSINDDGVLVESDSELIFDPTHTSTVNAYHESSKKWVGVVKFEYSCIATLAFNYGLCKYEDAGNLNFTARGVEVTGIAGGNDTSGDFDIELLHHKEIGWTYSASAFVPGSSAICSLRTDTPNYNKLVSKKSFAYKRANLETYINGANSEGILFRITCPINNTIQSADIHLQGLIESVV